MKKLGVSIFALLVSLPMIAKADPIAEFATFSNEQIAADSKIAKTDYVKGAYNAITSNLNTVATAVNTNTTAIAGKQAALTTDGNGAPAISTTVKTAIGTTGNTSDTSLVTETAVRSAITSATSGMLTSANLTGKQDALTTDGSGTPAISTTVKTAIGTTGNTSDTSLVTESAVRTAIDNATGAGSALATDVATLEGVVGHAADTVNDTPATGLYLELDAKQDVADSTVATLTSGSYNHITAGNGVGANLVALDTAVGTLESAVTAMATAWTGPSAQ